MSVELKRNERFRQAETMVKLGLGVNCILMVVKMLAGHFGQSSAVFADGMESACDLVISVASLAALRFCRQPFDSNHPYGHGRAESLMAFIVGLIIILTSVWILYSAITTIATGSFMRPKLIAVFVAALTIVIKEILARMTFRKANQLTSPVLSAQAHDHRKDAVTSIGTLVGCSAAALGWGIFDPISAGITGLLIAYVGIGTVRKAAHDLIDAALPETHLNAISAVAASVEGVDAVHEIRGRRSGQFIIVDLKLEMNSAMTVGRSHEIATLVKQKIFEADPNVGDIMIHINPHDDPDHEDLIRL